MQTIRDPPQQATLERDGALAGQEVRADVLRMEVGALEGELRRARQELGACEAGRREVWVRGLGQG